MSVIGLLCVLTGIAAVGAYVFGLVRWIFRAVRWVVNLF